MKYRVRWLPARERVETMNKQNFTNLLTAMSVEKYLFDIFGSSLDMAYSPDTGTMVIHYKDTRSNTLKNIIESVKTGTHKKADRARYFGVRGKTTSGARLEFTGGFSVMAIHEI
jgi:hypothetical protein